MDLKRIDDEEKIGVVETHHDNGQLKTRTNFKNGKPDGLRETWHETVNLNVVQSTKSVD